MSRRAAAIAIVLAAAAPAAAYPTGGQFDLDALTDNGAGGVAFTGAPRFAGHTCAVCHTGGPGRIGAELRADPVALFDDGYEPGTTYHLQVVLTRSWAAADRTAAGDDCGEQGAGYTRCDDNGFALELDDAEGYPMGMFAPRVAGACAPGAANAAVRVLDDRTAVTHGGEHHGIVQWDLCWTAPGAGAGALTAYVALVDGNGGDGTAANPNDVLGDDVFAGAVAVRERGGELPPADTGGCDAGGRAGAGAALLVALALIATRRRGRAAVVAAVIATLAAGCIHVKPHQREGLAKRKMVFAPDPREDELDLHMQESREGSAGGYGSAGGGCGCN